MDEIKLGVAANRRTVEVWLRVHSHDELVEHEAAILERIGNTKDGAPRFLTHPFLLLRDLGVELAPALVAELVKSDPRLATVSERAYHALRDSTAKRQTVRYRLGGLFRRGAS